MHIIMTTFNDNEIIYPYSDGKPIAESDITLNRQRKEIQQALNDAVPKLVAMGLSVEQVALGLSFSVEKVRRLIKE
jgi:predicted transposase YdaD